MDAVTLRKILARKFKRFKKVIRSYSNMHKGNAGFCSCCERRVRFIEYGPWLRDEYRCSNCNSIPRNRALIKAIQKFAPNYREVLIHESSPGMPTSRHLKRNCKHYSDSHFFPGVEPGKMHQGFRCENLDKLTFDDNSFDLFITSDVFEHVMNPEKAFAEIARVLKPGGLHIFTMPWYPELRISRRRAMVNDAGEIKHIEEAIYHGNPISDKGSLVTIDWGLDFCDKVYDFSRMTTTIYLERDRSSGLDGKFLEVFISRKAHE